jgi:hypothetical protein
MTLDRHFRFETSSFRDLHEKRPDFDIQAADLSDKALLAALLGTGQDAAEKAKHLRGYQRLARLGCDEPLADSLREAGYHSAQGIAATTERVFLRRSRGKINASEEDLRELHRRARLVKARVHHLWANLRDALSPHLRATRFYESAEHFVSLVADIPDYESLFGGATYCACPECRSVLGPAAYFTDLMRITQVYITDENPSIGIYSLKTRRPDLFSMELTCENTTGMVPFLSIANQVLANVLAPGKSQNEADYVAATSVEAFGLPINMPLETVRVSLTQMNSSLAKLYTALQDNPDGTNLALPQSNDVTREWAGLSVEQQRIAMTPTADSAKLATYYNVANLNLPALVTGATFSAVANATDVTASSGSFKTQMAIGDVIQIAGVSRLVTAISTTADSFTVDAPYTAAFTNQPGLVIAGTSLVQFDRFSLSTGLDYAGLKSLFTQGLNGEEQAANIAAFFFINGGTGTGNWADIVLDKTDPLALIQYVAGQRVAGGTTTTTPITLDALDRINRFTRLAGWTGLTYPNLDIILRSLGNPDLSTPASYGAIAAANLLAATFPTLKIDQAASLWSDMNTYGRGSGSVPGDLYDQVYNRPALLHGRAPYRPTYAANPLFTSTPITWTIAGEDEASATTRAWLTGSLGLSDDDLTAIALLVGSGQAALTLSVTTLSQLYRVRLLAKTLSLSIPNILRLLTLAGLTTANWSIADVKTLIELKAWVDTSGFQLPDLIYLTTSIVEQGYKPPIPATGVLPFLNSLWTSSADWMVTPARLQFDTQTPEQGEATFKAMVKAGYVSPIGIVLITSAQFSAVAAKHAVTAAELEAAGLISQSAAQEAFSRLVTQAIISAAGVLNYPVDRNTDLSFLFPPSAESENQIAWVRSVLEAKSNAAGFDLISPVMPVTVAMLSVGTITPAEAQAALTALQTHNVLDANNALIAPFAQPTDLSYLFSGDTKKIEMARSVLKAQSMTVQHAAAQFFNGFNTQTFGTYGALSGLGGVATATINFLAPDMAAAVKLGEVVPALLTPIPPDKPLGQPLSDFFALYSRLSLVIRRLRLESYDVEGAIEHPAIFGFSSLYTIDMNTLRGLRGYTGLVSAFSITNGALITVLAFPDPSFAGLAALTGWERAQIEQLADAFWPPNGTGWNTVGNVSRMSHVFDLATAIGLNIFSLLSVAGMARLASLPVPPLDAKAPAPAQWANYIQTSQIIFSTLGAYYAGQGLPIPSDVTGTINETRRNAYLPIALHVTQANYPEVLTPRALSELLLLDLETSGCEQTSPIAQGIASVQNYMQRCRLQLERGVTTVAIDPSWWQWLTAYRVWEANRKIYIYPENYLEPGLRKNKTPLFKEYESALGENEINEQTVYNAYTDFMNGFSSQAAIQIIDAVRADAPDPDTGAMVDTLFLVGRSPSEPYDFFIRRRLANIAWTAWEKVDIKITSERVMPVYSLGRLFLFWVNNEAIEESNISGSTSNVTQTNTLTWRASIQYSVMQFGGTWTPPQTVIDKDIYAFEGYTVNPAYAPWGIDYTTIQPRSVYWQQPYLLNVPADDPTQERLVVLLGGAWQQNNATAVAAPPVTPFTPLNSLLWKVHDAAEMGVNAINAGFVGAVPLLKGYSLDSNLIPTEGQAIMQTIQATGPVYPIYGSPYTVSATGNVRMGLYLATNLFITDSLAGTELLSITDPQLNPWYQAGPQPLLYNLAPNIAVVRPVKNQIGWMILNNGDEAFLATAQIPNLKSVSEVVDYNPITINGPSDIVLFSNDYAQQTPDITKVQVKFTRLTTGAIERVRRILWGGGVSAMLNIKVQQDPGSAGLSFTRFYQEGVAPPAGICDPKGTTLPAPANVIPPQVLCGGQIDFGSRTDPSAYGLYWRELYFQIPYLNACQLNRNQQFEAAKTWFEYIFDPTSDQITNPPSDRFWQYLPFRGLTVPSLIDILTDNEAIRYWNNHPFDPFAVADMRLTAYQKGVVMRYIDNLIDWGDYLFAQDTRESVTQASLLYFLAADILGPRPQSRGDCFKQPDMSFNDILAKYPNPEDIPEFLINLEQQVPGGGSHPVTIGENALPYNDINAYFCVPENPELIAYWDRVEDRLFKIRHCQNLAGEVRMLPLFEPPINPLQLMTNGNLSDLLKALDASIPNYRFWSMLERAKSLASALMGYGQSLLSALERKDGEDLAVLQNTQERQILKLTTKLRELAAQEAEDNLAALETQLESATARKTYYDGLIATGLLEREKIAIIYTIIGGVMTTIGGAFHTSAGIAHLIPNSGAPTAMTYGGREIGASLSGVAAFFDTIAAQFNMGANLATTLAGYDRREAEWQFQSDMAGYDVTQIGQQIDGANVRIQMAERDLEINTQQIINADATHDFLTQKFTNAELYSWLAKQLSGVFFQTYKIAYDMALSAQKALQFELDTTDSFVSFGYWNSLRKGLTCGEQLMLALNQMEDAYMRRNSRRLVIQKTVSLMQLDPGALMQLRQTGSCTFALPAALFDQDFPGHYARKIQSLSITVPAVTGPYQNINGTLMQTGNAIVMTANPDTELFLLGKDGMDPPDSTALRLNWRANQAIAISTGVNDSGILANGENDDRYAPFEGTGAISQWRLDIPSATNRFDIGTIPDVVLNIGYTALSGGETMKAAVVGQLQAMGYTSSRLTFLANQYADDWFALMNPPPKAPEQVMVFQTPRSLYPGNLESIELTSVALILSLAPDVTFTGSLTVKLDIPGVSTQQVVTFTSSKLAAIIPISPSDPDFMSGDWTMTIPVSGIPTGLQNPATGFLDPAKLLNIGMITAFTASINWT